jgi:hypothetical protein
MIAAAAGLKTGVHDSAPHPVYNFNPKSTASSYFLTGKALAGGFIKFWTFEQNPVLFHQLL